MEKTKKRSKKKIVLIIVAAVLALIVGGWWAFCDYMYDDTTCRRFESYEPVMLRVEDFDGLQRTRYEFPSNKGQTLVGYMYSSDQPPESDRKGIIIIAHGFGGGGHNSYMDCADYFARRGYYVFAYDCTGCDESGGDGVGGFTQGVIDLDYAISFVEESGNFPELPIALFGHSWGAYSVSNVLTYHPEVKAVIECCGCNRSSDLFESGGKDQAGDLIYTMTPFVRLHERVRFGKYASNTALDGFAATDAAVMVVHSADDNVVGIEYGYDKYYEKYKDDPRFTFVRFEDKGHNDILNDSSNTYADELDDQFADWLEKLDYPYKDEANKERFAKDKADFINTNLDRAKWSSRIDTELFDRFVSFYDEHING